MIFYSPMAVPGGKKEFSLNLNGYRNAHYFTLSKAKKSYAMLMHTQIARAKKIEKCTIEYVVYPMNKQKFDLGNIVAIHKKFFEDALVNAGKIADDNYHYIVGNSERFGGIDEKNPRVEIIITEAKI